MWSDAVIDCPSGCSTGPNVFRLTLFFSIFPTAAETSFGSQYWRWKYPPRVFTVVVLPSPSMRFPYGRPHRLFFVSVWRWDIRIVYLLVINGLPRPSRPRSTLHTAGMARSLIESRSLLTPKSSIFCRMHRGTACAQEPLSRSHPRAFGTRPHLPTVPISMCSPVSFHL